MGNAESSPRSSYDEEHDLLAEIPLFPGSALVESALQCGQIDDEGDNFGKASSRRKKKKKTLAAQLLSHAENCVMSPQNSVELNDSDSDEDNGIRHPDSDGTDEEGYEEFDHRGRMKSKPPKPQKVVTKPPPSPSTRSEKGSKTSTLLAKSLMSEVGNPNSMTQDAMAQREKKLLKAQNKARMQKKLNIDTNNSQIKIVRPVGSPSEGVGQPSVLGSIAHALTGTYNDPLGGVGGISGRNDASVIPPNSLMENRAAQVEQRKAMKKTALAGKHTVTIGLSLSRRSSSLGHPDTVTRQTAFDFNELQDREYKYVSSTDSSGWRAGGGEKGCEELFGEDYKPTTPASKGPGTPSSENKHKIAAPDTVHIPIIQINAESPQVVDSIISALARGEIFIPHMAIIPEALSVNGVSPPDLVVRFGTERNDDLPPDEWSNWCLEFMHNQLYEYFYGMGAQWSSRPFSITLAKKVRWRTVKHMNRYFSHAERVIDGWREKGPQYLDPQLAYIEGGATPEEVARPHGIYLFRNGVPTNYFAPNFHPPYTTKMTRSLLFNVLGKSWDKKRREWSSVPIPKLITPSILVSAMCGCTDNQASGFVASEATIVEGPSDRSTKLPAEDAIRSFTPKRTPKNSFRLTADANEAQEEKKEEDNNKVRKIPTPKQNAIINLENYDQNVAVPALNLQVSSGSDSNGIPSPPMELSPKKFDDPKPEHKSLPLQASSSTHGTRAKRDASLTQNEVQDENSGDSGNQDSVNSRKEKKGSKTENVSDEKWLSGFDTPLGRKEYSPMTAMNEQHPIVVARAQIAPSSSGFGSGSPTVRSNNSSKSSRNTSTKQNEVGALSMEYSQDDSTCVKSVGEYTFDSTLLGQNFAGESKSVMTVATKDTFATTKDILEELKAVPENTERTNHSISMESAYTTVDDERVPSDEELFAVGWAKAMDASSGNYYYFTLDRKKTVWENPLAPPSSPTNSEDSSVGDM